MRPAIATRSSCSRQGPGLTQIEPDESYIVDRYIERVFRMPFGPLYPILHRLEKEQMIVGSMESTNRAREKKIDFELFSKAVQRLVQG